MYFINPFKGLRPTKENASSVAVSSTDHLSKDSVVDHKNNNSWSYLNVFGEKDSSKSKEQFELMKKKSILKKDKKNSFLKKILLLNYLMIRSLIKFQNIQRISLIIMKRILIYVN